MNIKILDSWLREYLQTDATAYEVAKQISLTSVSIERVEKHKDDFIYDIEVTTNRPDLASVNGLAREAGTVLPQNGIRAIYKPLVLMHEEKQSSTNNEIASSSLTPVHDLLKIELAIKAVNRVCAVVMDVKIDKSPEQVIERLETSGIRSLNNLIDITNYVMRVTGQPTHVFDYDRLGGTELTIREAKTGEEITTLDNKTYTLNGGEVIAENEKGEIVDLLAIMGLKNSVVTEQTKRIVFFVNNIDSNKIRKASMNLGIRTEAAQLNEKHLDPNLCEVALQYGIQLYQELAEGKVVSPIIDLYPHASEEKQVVVSLAKINSVIGIDISAEKSIDILTKLGFQVQQEEDNLYVTVPTIRAYDVTLPEDIIEEIARVYGYHNLPVELPSLNTQQAIQQEKNPFYWEQRIKNTLKYWGFTETYTYSMIPENLYEGPLNEAVTISNPLNEEFVYMRNTLIPSLLRVVSENKSYEQVKIFEIANVYQKRQNKLPEEIRMLAGVIKQKQISFFVVKGYLQQLFNDLGVNNYEFKPSDQGGDGTKIYVAEKYLGDIEILDENLIDFELNFELLIAHASLRKTYIPASKFPPVLEDISLVIPADILTQEVIDLIKKQSSLIVNVELIDRYENNRTFHVIYRDNEKNLTQDEIKTLHEKILSSLKKKWQIKEE